MTDDIAIKVSGVSKTFKLPHEKHSSVKSAFINFYKQRKGYETQKVLTDISFEIKKGEFFGIVGRNGSGKSTLLKLISQIYTPDKGSITVNGKLTPFIELGVGFNPELSGRENVYLNGALLGFSRKEMEAMYDEIVSFAELERFMDQKLKNYSSGMQVRLAFSIAIRANTDILVLDEVLAVGDAVFQQKCIEYFEQVKKEEKTVILVTHAMESVKRFCTKALLITDGKIKSVGSPEEIANQYTLDMLNAEKKAGGVSKDDGSNKKLSKQVKNLKITPKSPLALSSEDYFIFDITYELVEDLPVDLGISVLYRGVSLVEHNTRELKIGHNKHTEHTLTYKLPLEMLNPGRYDVSAAIFEKKTFKLIGFDSGTCSFLVNENGKDVGGVLAQRGQWITGHE